MAHPLADPPQLFARFDSDNLSSGAARARFESFVTDLVKVQWVDAMTVSARNHNDWGIDTFVGDLGGGDVSIWQSKYFLEWQDDSPQSQVRDSFKSASTKAEENGYRIVEWTLVVPAVLHPKQMKWFQAWAGRTRRSSGTRITIWQGDTLRHRLMSAEAFEVRREYFPHTMDPVIPDAPDVAFTEDYTAFDDALFVRQLHAAGFTETSAACGMYFATEALRRDLEAKQSAKELQALRTVQLDVHGVWETRFNEHAAGASADGRMHTLYRIVIDEAGQVPDAPGLSLQRAHKQGAAHILVEDHRAGWVTHWRDVAAQHAAEAQQLFADGHDGDDVMAKGSHDEPRDSEEVVA